MDTFVPKKVIIMGAAGRDFHNFNIFYRDNPRFNVVAFTATQIPDIAGRKYPASLAGKLYPEGIPIYDESELIDIIYKHDVDECVFSYSDVAYSTVMGLAARVNTTSADFLLLGTKDLMYKSNKPVIAICAVRTGAGKSQTARHVIDILKEAGLKTITVRHPMPYGDLEKQKVQRFETIDDLKKHNCTIEEMEEYEPHIAAGNIIYSGVDYEAILRAAETDPKGCDVILWEGGNNDYSFFYPDLMIAVADPHRVGHESSYYPSEVTLRLSDIVIINKIDSAGAKCVQTLRENISKINPKLVFVNANSKISVCNPDVIKDKRVLVIEDGPTLTHGEMELGAGVVAAHRFGASELVDPRPYAVGKLKDTYEKYPHMGTLLPAMGYGEQNIKDLQDTIDNTPCDSVVIATPIDLQRVVNIKKPCTRVTYDLEVISTPTVKDLLKGFIDGVKAK